jgi:hypothetical protein
MLSTSAILIALIRLNQIKFQKAMPTISECYTGSENKNVKERIIPQYV